MQLEAWVILENEEYDAVWDKIYDGFAFHPSCDVMAATPAFRLPMCHKEYRFGSSFYFTDAQNELIKSIFASCMGTDDYMYALDWQHTGFRYNPKSPLPMQKRARIHDERYPFGGYIAEFPDFYPNGDYYFFIAKDFSWGYLSHPWQRKLWIFGDALMKAFEQAAVELDLNESALDAGGGESPA
ncbi:MAG TPA: DUF2716 domain-containing protein [Clostridia bacterium]|nr:DUF2716 domain-containing protein [Clostridia bacterium]